MGDPSLAGIAHHLSSISEFAGLLAIGLVVYLVGEAFYNLFLHPLAKVPGPFSCRISKLPWVCLNTTLYTNRSIEEGL